MLVGLTDVTGQVSSEVGVIMEDLLDALDCELTEDDEVRLVNAIVAAARVGVIAGAQAYEGLARDRGVVFPVVVDAAPARLG